jgi:hypothetical protein
MARIDSDRFKPYVNAAKEARKTWVAANQALLAVDRYNRIAWAQALEHNRQALNEYNSKAREVTTLMQLLLEQAEYYAAQPG